MAVDRIWIEAGCIQCAWCNDLAPEVFGIGETGSVVRGDARIDGVTDTNPAHRPLAAAILEARADFIEFVAAGCPTQVIKLGIAPESAG